MDTYELVKTKAAAAKKAAAKLAVTGTAVKNKALVAMAQALLDNGPLQENIVAVMGDLAGQNLVGDSVHSGIVAALVGQLCNLSKNAAANLVHSTVYTSHNRTSVF